MSTVWDELDVAWRSWATLGVELAEDDWQVSTRLPGWSVRDLYAHVAAWPAMFQRLVAGPARSGPADWSDAARRAASSRGPTTLADQFATVGRRALDAGRQQPNKLVDYLGSGTVQLVDAAEIGLLEAVVHRLDLNDALRRSDAPSTSSLARVRDLLVRMTRPVDFIEAATGRGDAQVLPVLR